MQQVRKLGVKNVWDSDLTVGDWVLQYCAQIGVLRQSIRVVITFLLSTFGYNTKIQKVRGEHRKIGIVLICLT